MNWKGKPQRNERDRNTLDGMLNIRKEAGYTSHDVVAKLRRILGIRRIGHTGTLDPAATGVLPVAVGKSTKLVDLIADRDKSYEAVMRLGVVTDTQDMTGTILETREAAVDEATVRRVCASFVGELEQIPPMYSAVRVGGRHLYELAREGKVIERRPRKITVYGVEVLSATLPLVKLSVTCSKGTYIRTLCHDIGNALGCGGSMETRVRTRVGEFLLEDSVTIGELEKIFEKGEEYLPLRKIDEILDAYPRVVCPREQDRLLQNGNPLSMEPSAAGRVRMYASDGSFRAVYEWKADRNCYMPVTMF